MDDVDSVSERILTQLLESTPSQKLFIPGNHDWGLSPKGQNREAITLPASSPQAHASLDGASLTQATINLDT